MRNIKKIVCGNSTFTDAEIVSGNIYHAASLPLQELEIDTFVFSIRSDSLKETDFSVGEKVQFFENDELIVTMYLSQIERVATNKFNFSCINAIGILDNQKHFGGMYNGNTFSDVLADVMGNAEYTLESALGNITIYGWLPISTRRDNLNQLLFAAGANIISETNGTLRVFVLSSDITNIAADRVFRGGSVKAVSPATEIDVTEHAYAALTTDEQVTLFTGSSSNGELVTFDNPMHDLAVDGTFKILASNANYAIIGAGAGTLTGKKYTHTAKLYRLQNNARSNASDSTKTVKDATLVNAINSPSIAERLMNYYGLKTQVQSDILYAGESVGQKISFTTPFMETDTGFIESVDVAISQIMRATLRVAIGFQPVKPGNYYENVIVISQSTTFAVPENCSKIRVVMIGHGSNGTDGKSGQDAPSGSFYSSRLALGGHGGSGGAAGSGGNGGAILESTVTVSPGQEFAVSISDEASTFGSLSSVDGVVQDSGFIELFSGNVYGAKGQDGYAGADGGDGGGWFNETNPDTGQNGYEHEAYAGGNVLEFMGGIGGKSLVEDRSNRGYDELVSRGSGGGGAAYGANGSPGNDGRIRDPGDKYARARIVVGGAGANAEPPTQPTLFGCGGYGGHGGGGGGGWGGAEKDSDDKASIGYNDSTTYWNPARGGTGSAGSAGVAGCVIIYY